MDKEDIVLIEKAKKNPASYEVLYKKYAPKVFNYLWYRVGHQKEVAEDLMQEVFMRAYKNLPDFHLRSHSYYSYLLTIAHNLLANYYRKPKVVSFLEAISEAPIEITQDIEKKMEAQHLWQAIQQLPQKDKDVLLLKYQKELPIKEIAYITNKTENAVKLALSRTRKKLAKHPHLQDIAKFAESQKKYTQPKFIKK